MDLFAGCTFFIHKSLYADRENIEDKITRNGGRLTDLESARFIVADKKSPAFKQLTILFKTHEVVRPSFLDKCIQADYVVESRQPAAKKKNQAAKATRTRTPYTQSDNDNLIRYLAHHAPCKVVDARCGNQLYQRMMILCEANGEDWVHNHTWHSWRERYVKHQSYFDPRIEEYIQNLYDNVWNEEQRRRHDERTTWQTTESRKGRAALYESDEDSEEEWLRERERSQLPPTPRTPRTQPRRETRRARPPEREEPDEEPAGDIDMGRMSPTDLMEEYVNQVNNTTYIDEPVVTQPTVYPTQATLVPTQPAPASAAQKTVNAVASSSRRRVEDAGIDEPQAIPSPPSRPAPRQRTPLDDFGDQPQSTPVPAPAPAPASAPAERSMATDEDEVARELAGPTSPDDSETQDLLRQHQKANLSARRQEPLATVYEQASPAPSVPKKRRLRDISQIPEANFAQPSPRRLRNRNVERAPSAPARVRAVSSGSEGFTPSERASTAKAAQTKFVLSPNTRAGQVRR